MGNFPIYTLRTNALRAAKKAAAKAGGDTFTVLQAEGGWTYALAGKVDAAAEVEAKLDSPEGQEAIARVKGKIAEASKPAAKKASTKKGKAEKKARAPRATRPEPEPGASAASRAALEAAIAATTGRTPVGPIRAAIAQAEAAAASAKPGSPSRITAERARDHAQAKLDAIKAAYERSAAKKAAQGA